MTEERLFSIVDADAELEALRVRLPRLRDARQRLIDTGERITSAVQIDGGGTEGSDWFRAQETLKRELLWLADRGILLRDPDTGLVDFPAEREGNGCSSVGGSGRASRVVPLRTVRVLQQEASVIA